MPPVIVLHYHEIALKGGNREWFERQLIGNVRHVLRDVAGLRVVRMSGRLAIRLTDGHGSVRMATDDTDVVEKLRRVFGIANIQIGYEVRQEREGLQEDVVAVVQQHLSNRHFEERGDEKSHTIDQCDTSVPQGHDVRSLAPLEMTTRGEPRTFAVRVKRGNKQYPVTSQDLEREIGASIVEATGLGVDLEHPDLTVAVEIVEDTAFVLLERVEGPGGLPVGVSGRVLMLLSSGFDSPVAAWRMMKRGCVTDFIHFHSYPYTSDASIRNVGEIVRLLNGWQQNRGQLHTVPLIEYQKVIMMSAPAPLRVLLYRRMMLRVAEAIAKKGSGPFYGAEALVTGENLGQVASQTIPNMAAVEAVATLPVFRPLLGYDKMEIIRQAEVIGTAAISSRPYDDCCSLFTPQHPATHASIAELDAAEASLEVGEWVERLIIATEHRTV